MPNARIQPGFGGMNSEASPDYVPPTQAAVLENLLPRQGKLVLRGPISAGINLGLADYSRVTGAMVFGSGLLLETNSNGSAGIKKVLSGVVTAGAGVVVGPRFCVLGNYAYALKAYASNLARWDGSGASANVVGGPANIADATVHLSRIFTITAATNVLSWSDVGGPVNDLASDWQDDVSGLTNQIVVGDKGDLVRGLGHAGKQLAILKDRSLWMVTGLTPASFSVNRVSSEWGCVSAESIVDHDDGCYFLSERGFAYFDGSQVTDVSTDIKSELLAAMRDAPLPYSGGTWRNPASLFPFARAARVGRDCIMLTIGLEFVATEQPTVYFCGIYDTKQGTWTKFSSDAFTVGAPVYYIPTPPSGYYGGATLGYDGISTLCYLDDIVSPESADPLVTGEDVVAATTAAIPAVSYSKILALSSPAQASQLKRVMLDYSFVVVADAATSVDAWEVSLVDGQGNALMAPTRVKATILASGYTAAQKQAALVRKRFEVEFFGEASEVQVRVTLPALAAAVTEVIAAEIHDATIKFDAGRDRPTA